MTAGFDALGDGPGVLAGSAFSIRFGFGVASSESLFFFGEGDFSASGFGLFFAPGFFVASGVSLALAFGFGVTSSSSPALFLLGDFAFAFGVGDSSSSFSSAAGLFFGRGDFVGSGVSVGFAFAFALGVGVGLAFFLFFDLRLAGFGFAVGSGVADGVGEATARISSRAFFFFSSLVDWARSTLPITAARAQAVPRKTRSRITVGERNRARCSIKRAVAPLRPRGRARRAPVPGAEWRSISRREEEANRSGTSRS